MSKKIIGTGILMLLGIGIVGVFLLRQNPASLPPLLQPTPVPTPLAVYSFPSLSQTQFDPQPIHLGRILHQTDTFISQLFYLAFRPNPSTEETKTVSGVINLPKKPGKYPILVMFRGYVPPEKYSEGAGTQPSASVYVQHGFITLAPDFLGFGESDSKADDQFESRFQTYTTALSLLASLPTLNDSLNASYSGELQADTTKVGIWGHSNGGHIALSILAMSGGRYPTVLWAPVSKSFPYSNLAYTDEDDDQGKAYRKDLARFETLYDTDLFSPPVYFSSIQAPLQIYQGTNDQEVPVWWSDELVENLKKMNKEVEYVKYQGADHNLRPNWNDVVNKNIEFFQTQLSRPIVL